jgi:hypothetical protein
VHSRLTRWTLDGHSGASHKSSTSIDRNFATRLRKAPQMKLMTENLSDSWIHYFDYANLRLIINVQKYRHTLIQPGSNFGM